MGDKKPVGAAGAVVFDPFFLPRPLDFKALFGREGPLELEIGFGRGDFLVHRARQVPGSNIVGLEVSSLSVLKAWRRIKSQGISNIRLAKAEAQETLHYFFPETCLERTWVLFPDPWPKKRHAKRRLLCQDFFQLLSSRTVDRGTLVVATDEPGYRDWILEQNEAAGGFRLTDVREGAPPTKYHAKWKARGKRVFTMIFQKSAHPRVRNYFPMEVNMSHIKLREHRGLTRAVEEFSPVSENLPGGILRVEKAYLSQDKAQALFLCLSSEDGFVQHFFVSARQRADHILVKPHDPAHLIITPGVKMCVEAVAELIISRRAKDL